MKPTRGYAALKAWSLLAPFEFERRDLRPWDILITIDYCGICHSDIHQARDEWGGATFPMVPGHEIVGRVVELGSEVTGFAVGDRVGVGCLVDSCRHCRSCREGLEQHCEEHVSWTYNGTEQDRTTPTYGGYSSTIVCDQNFALKIPPTLDLAAAAPLLCAGITTYSPMKRLGVGAGHRVGILGFGGLGHIAVKLACSLGAEVTVLSTSPAKKTEAERLGAHHYVHPRDATEGLTNHFDFLVNTVSASHDLSAMLSLLRRDGTMILVGAPAEPVSLEAFALIPHRRRLVGSLIGGIRETQEMLDYCGAKNIACDIELIDIQQVNEAYERMIRGDVRFRFVIDMRSL